MLGFHIGVRHPIGIQHNSENFLHVGSLFSLFKKSTMSLYELYINVLAVGVKDDLYSVWFIL